jgi:ABC-2 type transport system permease protein
MSIDKKMNTQPLPHKALAREIRGSYAFITRNINLIKRYWVWEIVWLVYATVNALSITFIGKASGEITGQAIPAAAINDFILYLMVGTLVWHYLAVVFDIVSESIQWERWEGTIEYTFMAPVSRVTHLLGQALFGVIYGIIHTAFILTVVVIFFDINLQQANFPTMILMLVAGSLGFIGLGLIAAVLPLLWPEKGVQMTNIIKATIMLVSGIYYPISVLPTWLQPLGQISPATYMLVGMREALLENATIGDVLTSALVPLCLSALVSIPLGLFVFGRAEAYAKRAGVLKRNG